MTFINMSNVAFKYKKDFILKDINLYEKEPVITGIWGRNGAGKTTLMKLISGQEFAESGNIHILDEHPFNNGTLAKNISYLREDHYFGRSWKIKDALYFASLFNENWNQIEADELVEHFRLPRNKRIVTFSKGMHTMVQLIIGLASHAPVTIFDEPTNGLDAHIRKKFFRALKASYEEDPRFMLISSHHIHEVEPLCEKLIILSDQTIQYHESIEYFQVQGVSLMGDLEVIQRIVKPESILETSYIMDQAKVMVDVPMTEALQDVCAKHHIKIEKAPIQDFLVNITA